MNTINLNKSRKLISAIAAGLMLCLMGFIQNRTYADEFFPEEIEARDTSSLGTLGTFKVSKNNNDGEYTVITGVDKETSAVAPSIELPWTDGQDVNQKKLSETVPIEVPWEKEDVSSNASGIYQDSSMFKASKDEPSFLFQPVEDSLSENGYYFSNADIMQPAVDCSAGLSSDIYSFIHISDTQYSTALAPEVFYDQCQYIVQEQRKQNIRFVAHTGDIIDCAPLDNQWINAKNAVNILENAAVPRQIIAGNHDIGSNDFDYNDFLTWFGADTYVNNYTYMYSYNNGEALVQLVDAGNGHIWMFVGVGWCPTNDALLWAASVMSNHIDCPAVIMTHDYLNTDGHISEIGNRIAYYLVDPFPNTHLVLCGHNHAYATNVAAYDDNRDGMVDRRVYAMLADYQADGDQRTGKLRILTVSEPEGLIYVRTYSTEAGSFVDDDAFVIMMDGNWFELQDSGKY